VWSTECLCRHTLILRPLACPRWGRERSNGAVASGLDWLEHRAATCSAPCSLAWSVLPLDAYGPPIGGMLARLYTLSDKGLLVDPVTLAAVILAIDCLVQGNVSKVIA
jgi:hypothetical protein